MKRKRPFNISSVYLACVRLILNTEVRGLAAVARQHSGLDCAYGCPEVYSLSHRELYAAAVKGGMKEGM